MTDTSDPYEGSYAASGPTGMVGYRGPSYAGLWRTWTLKTAEQYAEAAAAAWLGDPGQAVQHMTDWGALTDRVPFSGSYDQQAGYASGDPRAGGGTEQEISPSHGVADTAVGRQQLGAGHVWADPVPPTLTDHQDYPASIGGGGAVSAEDWNGDDLGQHNVDWGDLGDRHSGDWQLHGKPGQTPSLDDTYIGADDVNYPAAAHQIDKGEIASKQRRQPTRIQASDEKDTLEGYQFHPGQQGGSTAQLRYAHFADPQLNEPIVHRAPGVEHGRAAGPALSFNTNSDHVSTRTRRWVERRIPGRHIWRHDQRPQFWRFAKSASVTAPGDTHQTSPFPAGPMASRTTVFMQPVLRRTPPAWDLTATSDGSEQVDTGSGTADMWSGFGGM